MQVVTVEEIVERLERALPGARVRVSTFQGNDHFEAVVEAPQFENQPRIEQHRMVYAALEGLIGGPIHALALKTRTPRTGEGETG